MKTILTALLAATASLTTGMACAHDQGIINQAGPYEATIKFYTHPAHFFWSSTAPQQNGQHPTVLVKLRAEEANTQTASMPSQPALAHRQHTVLAKAATQR